MELTKEELKKELADVQYKLGALYLILQHRDEAFYWYEKSADQGYDEAQYYLGYLYENHCKDYKKAMDWYLKAAEQGHADAQDRLNRLKEEGKND